MDCAVAVLELILFYVERVGSGVIGGVRVVEGSCWCEWRCAWTGEALLISGGCVGLQGVGVQKEQ